jgi:hypothetical protein
MAHGLPPTFKLSQTIHQLSRISRSRVCTYQYDVDTKLIRDHLGTAIYYLAPLWPYDVNTSLTLDKSDPIVINLTDPNNDTAPFGSLPTVQSQILWQQSGLDNIEHNVLLSLASGGTYIAVDALMYVSLNLLAS